MTEFNPDDILNATVPTDELDGKKPRTPEGGYPNSVITDIKAFEPHEKSKERGVQARILVTFECAESDVDISTFMNFKTPVHPKATYAKLLRALWPDKEEASTKTMRDMIGENVNVNVFHESTSIDGKHVDYDEFRFTTCTAARIPFTK